MTRCLLTALGAAVLMLKAATAFAQTSAFNFQVQEKWRTDTALIDVFSTQTLAVGDIDNDGVVEIIAHDHNHTEAVSLVGPGDTLFILNGNTGSVEGYLELNSTGFNVAKQNPASVVIASLDADPFAEIILMTENSTIVCFEHTGGAPIWTSPSFSTIVGSPLQPILNVADFNGDGSPEIYAGPHVFNGQNGTLIGSAGFSPLVTAIGTPLNQGGASAAYGMSTAADVLPSAYCLDCDGLEIVCGFQVFSVNVDSGTVNPVVSTTFGPSSPADGFTAVADYDHDGDLDGIIATNLSFSGGGPTDVQVYVWDLQTPAIIANSPIYVSPTFGSIGQATVADFDGDALVEIGFAIEDQYIVLDDFLSLTTMLWSHTIIDESGFTGSAAFDFDGNGTKEIVYRDEDSLYVFNGGDGSVLFSTLCRGGTLMEKPVVADVDNDQEAEIVCPCSEYSVLTNPPLSLFLGRLHGYVGVYESAGDPWAPARSLWNQSSYHVTNIENDLSVPVTPENHHEIYGGVLNGFNLQLSSYDSLGNVVFPTMNTAPVARVDSFQLAKNSFGTSLPVMANDTDSNGDSLSLSILIPPVNGVASVSGSNVVYQPNPTFVGIDSFQYVICDSMLCDSAWTYIEVYFEDIVPPTAVCSDDTLFLDNDGLAFLQPMELDGGSSDDCGIDSLWLSQSNFSVADLGTNPVQLFVLDIGGNIDSCSAMLTVLDTNSVGISSGLSLELKIYPNPSTGRFIVSTIGAGLNIDRVLVFDLKGKIVAEYSPASREERLDLSHLAKGVYQVQVLVGDQKLIGRIALE